MRDEHETMILIWRQLALPDYWKTVLMYELKYKGCHASIKLHTFHVVTGHAVVGRIKLWGLKYTKNKMSKRLLISEHMKKKKKKNSKVFYKYWTKQNIIYCQDQTTCIYHLSAFLPIFTCWGINKKNINNIGTVISLACYNGLCFVFS